MEVRQHGFGWDYCTFCSAFLWQPAVLVDHNCVSQQSHVYFPAVEHIFQWVFAVWIKSSEARSGHGGSKRQDGPRASGRTQVSSGRAAGRRGCGVDVKMVCWIGEFLWVDEWGWFALYKLSVVFLKFRSLHVFGRFSGKWTFAAKWGCWINAVLHYNSFHKIFHEDKHSISWPVWRHDRGWQYHVPQAATLYKHLIPFMLDGRWGSHSTSSKCSRIFMLNSCCGAFRQQTNHSHNLVSQGWSSCLLSFQLRQQHNTMHIGARWWWTHIEYKASICLLRKTFFLLLILHFVH